MSLRMNATVIMRVIEWIEPKMKTVQGTHGLTSISQWVGAPLLTILNEVGVKSGAKWLHFDLWARW